MANFFIGQRVRIVHAMHSTSLIGRETRIVGFVNDAWDGRSYYSGWITSSINNYGRNFIAKDCQIEPILPEGHQPSEFSFAELMDNLGVVVA
ncbi:hypothetical protein BRC2024_HCTLARHO_CDS_0024 [Acinetobacter phage vB_AbaS_Silvergun]